MKLLYATTNNAKLKSMQRIANTLDIEIFGLKDLENISEFKNIKLPQINESGKDPLENAIIKSEDQYGISNQVLPNQIAEVSIQKGRLLLIRVK